LTPAALTAAGLLAVTSIVDLGGLHYGESLPMKGLLVSRDLDPSGVRHPSGDKKKQ
jgi:hypothetical protein